MLKSLKNKVKIISILFIVCSSSLQMSSFLDSNIASDAFENLVGDESENTASIRSSGIIASDHLVAHYDFEDSEDLGRDVTNNGHDGTPEVVSQYLDPERGNVLDIPESNSRIRLINDVDLDEQWTISAWFKDIVQVGRWQMLVCGQGQFWVGGYPNTYDLGTYDAGWSGIGHDLSSYTGWHHLVATGHDSQTDFYIDGEFLGSANRKTMSEVYILGNYRSNNYRFADYLDDIRIYDVELTDEEIVDIYNGDQKDPWYSDGNEYQYRFSIDVTDEMNLETDKTLSQKINFTDQLSNMRLSADIDLDSAILVEYNSTSSLNGERTMTIDWDDEVIGFDSQLNATATISWIKNGSDTISCNNTYGGFIRNWAVVGTETRVINLENYYSPDDITFGYQWDEYLSNGNYIDFSVPLGVPGGTNHYAWAQTYIYFPETVDSTYTWFTAERLDDMWLYWDGVNRGYNYNDSTADLTQYIRYNLAKVTKGWHSLLVRYRNRDGDSNWGFTTGFSSSNNVLTEIPDLALSTTYTREVRKYYVYFNTTGEVESIINNNYFGGYAYLNQTSSFMGMPEIYVNPPTYREYQSNLAMISEAPWWDAQWSYRLNLNLSSPKGNHYYSNYLIEEELDFTEIFTDLGVFSTFDENSIRIIEWDEFSGESREIPYQFDKDEYFIAENNAKGTLCWVADGKTTSSRSRFYFIYFDNTEFDYKDAVNYTSSSALDYIMNDNDDFTIRNSKIQISLAEGLPPVGQYHDHIYEVTDLRSGKTLTNPGTSRGWALKDWQYGGITQRYDTEPYNCFYGLSSLQIVSSGPIRVVMKMVFDSSDFIYERFYTLNYLDDTIKIDHQIYAKTAVGAGYWTFTNDWSQPVDEDTAYGFGGMNFDDDADLGIDGSKEFCTDDSYSSIDTTATYLFRKEAWHTMWDENDMVGVGTVWDIAPTTSYSYLYRATLGVGGLSNSFQIRAQAVPAGDTMTFTMYGQVFDNYDGGITKIRAKGLQNDPRVIKGTAVENYDARIMVNLKDIDQKIIEGAFIQISNSSGEDITIKQSNSFGNVSFKGLYDDIWSFSVKYSVNDAVNYTIFTKDITFSIGSDGRRYYDIFNCNLTTLNIFVADIYYSDYDDQILRSANVTLMNATSGVNVNITSSLTNSDGIVTFRLPATQWNFSVSVKNKLRSFIIGNDIGQDENLTNTIVLTSLTSVVFNVSIQEHKTKLTISSFSSQYWSSQNITTIEPYSIEVYYGEIFSLELYFEDIQDGVPIIGAGGVWSLLRKDSNQIVNSSTNIGDLDVGSGFYNLSFYTESLFAGTYIFSLLLNKTDLQDSFLEIEIEILNFNSYLEMKNEGEDFVIQWNSALSLQVDYYSVYPEMRNISNAILNYEVVGRSVSGVLEQYVLNQDMDDNWCTYNLSIVNLNLPVGIYTLRIFGNQTNYKEVDQTYALQIIANPTVLDVSIDNLFAYTSTYMKGAKGEIITFQINYTDLSENYLGLSASVSAFIEGVEDNAEIPLFNNGNGVYNCSIDVDLYDIGKYDVKIQASKLYYESKSIYLDLEILDYWDTNLEIITPPTVYPWNNISSFVVRYESVDPTRSDVALDAADVLSLNITHKVEGIELQLLSLGENQRGLLWDWENLKNNPNYGSGYYLIWFNTSVVSVESSGVFYAIPTLDYSLYQNASIRPYIWITALRTGLTPSTTEIQNVESFELILDQSTKFSVKLNVTDESSAIYGKNIEGAQLNYQIVSREDESQILQSGILDDLSNGLYQFSLNAIKIGEYKIYVTSFLENYTSTTISAFFNCLRKEFSLQTGLNIDNNTIFTPKNREISFSINIADKISGISLSDVSVSFELNGKTYNLIEDSATAGVYSITLSLDELALLEARNQPYQFNIIITRENYTTTSIPIAFQVGLPIDPLIGVTYRSWMIIGATIGAMAVILATYSYIKYANIPLIIKQIDATKKDIEKKRSIGDELITVSAKNEILERLKNRWSLIDLDLAAVLNLDEVKSNKDANVTSGDEKVGGL
ncbi:hypothetical protein NEF87_001534 [Candidatus Lokiarchaeum ossiferum]|uniref:PA14 domain-containing protein n=1 Tax=Candidatus Lokiarchaeum ossiferum TaxID=2951803 RepID=A0ABY6HP10_9ARCH|nr:hypothetical protein NEF87_001534 [Candidatus Lokiarchaeum sp. B-35]